MKTILTLDDLYDISEFLNEHSYNDAPITIVIDVLTKERLQTINDMFFNETNDGNNKINDVDQIKVDVMGVTFIYRLKENDNENREQVID